MSFARNIIRDLVEKRLWPVAVLLVVAIVAIPVLGGGTGSSAGAGDDAPPIAPGDAASASSAVKLLGPPSVRSRPGKVVDPFRRAKKKDEDTTGSATATKTGDTAATGGTTPPGDTTAPGIPTIRPSLSVYRTSVRWGVADAETPKARRISRLTPLGELLNPSIVFMGVEAGGKTALFLLGPDATSVGEGDCRAAKCRVVALERGEVQIVDFEPAGGERQQYALELASIRRSTLSTAAKADAARSWVHPDGRDVIILIAEDEDTKTAIQGFAYDRSRGVVVDTASASGANGQ